MSSRFCPECDRLWLEYEGAVFAHARAVNRLGIAGFSNDMAGRRRLSEEADALMCRRVTLREAIHNHDLAAHSSGNKPVDFKPASGGAAPQHGL